jgi:hypothetical protein
MCVLTLRIIFACLSKAWFDPEREFQERLTTTGEPVVFIIKRTTSNRGSKRTVTPETMVGRPWTYFACIWGTFISLTP